MPEDRMGHVAEAAKDDQAGLAGPLHPGDQSGQRASRARQGCPRPGRSRAGRRQHGHGPRGVRQAAAQADRSAPGATVTGKIYCGRVSIGYKFLHPVIAWFQAKVLFQGCFRTRHFGAAFVRRRASATCSGSSLSGREKAYAGDVAHTVRRALAINGPDSAERRPRPAERRHQRGPSSATAWSP